MNVREDLTKQIATAMKAKDKVRLAVLRMLLSSVKYKEIEQKSDLSDEEFLQLISTTVKQRKDSIEQYKTGGRKDLVEKEEAELEVVMEFLPEQLSEDEVRAIVEDAVKSTGAASPKEMGKVMGAIMPKVKGKADGKLIQDLVKKALGAE
ncbi:MAG: GatB/YqeY domain-containing protein [Deltaproteobacteria bacterium]|nr:GatB/YqeY domain-containing protein [Deltaproteobacteria bacterium]